MLLERFVYCITSFCGKLFKKMPNFFLKVIFNFLPDLIRNLISLVK
ncbi:hypothetical protein PROCH_1069 [Prochlorococcus marinus str. EQPAC1]|nr:hypothetical protein PROCH_1069 [Prochlorococcus marinus str. EQPAC1]